MISAKQTPTNFNEIWRGHIKTEQTRSSRPFPQGPATAASGNCFPQGAAAAASGSRKGSEAASEFSGGRSARAMSTPAVIPVAMPLISKLALGG
jgi:hypothetical protein